MTALLTVIGAGGALLLAAAMTAGSRNLVHSVFWLAVTLLLTSGWFVALHAPFLAAVQIVLYTGGVITLMLFGVMLTQRQLNSDVPNPVTKPGPAALTALLMFLVLSSAIWGTPSLAAMQPLPAVAIPELGEAFLGPHLVAFEALSLLLLAAMVGAIVLARRRDP